MRNNDKAQIKLERQRQLINDRLEQHKRRINEQFDKKQAELNKRLNHKQEQIIAAAMALLDEEGLNSLSLRKLATKLDMQAPGLYWHFKNKELLIDYLAEEILKAEFDDLQPKTEEETWQEWLTSAMERLRKVMLAHTDGARVVAGAHPYPVITLGKIFETSLISLRNGGFDLTTALLTTMTATNYTFGYVIEEQASPTFEQMADIVDEIRGEYPVTAEAIKAVSDAKLSSSDGFRAGLKLIISGHLD
jgi:TetR/AcrR family tetracycline transcriptional repressor